MTKKEARNNIKRHFSNLSIKQKINLDSKILKNFKKFIDTSKYQKIGSYFSLNNEVSTKGLNEYLDEKGINIFLPKISEVKNNKKLNFLEYSREDSLIENKYSVLEPSKRMNEIEIKDLDLILIPLRAVNKNLFRLGYGGGFYDFSLSGIKPIKCLGLGYEFQIVNDLDIEPHDLKLGGLITPEGYFKNAL